MCYSAVGIATSIGVGENDGSSSVGAVERKAGTKVAVRRQDIGFEANGVLLRVILTEYRAVEECQEERDKKGSGIVTVHDVNVGD